FALVLRVGDVLEPGDVVAVEMLLQCDVHHIGIGAGAVPVLFAGRDPDRVAGADFAQRSTPQLHPSRTRYHVQGLSKRVGMPGGAGLGLEPDPGTADPCRRRRVDDGLLPHRPGEAVRRHPARGHGAQRFDVHGSISFRWLGAGPSTERRPLEARAAPGPGEWTARRVSLAMRSRRATPGGEMVPAVRLRIP